MASAIGEVLPNFFASFKYMRERMKQDWKNKSRPEKSKRLEDMREKAKTD